MKLWRYFLGLIALLFVCSDLFGAVLCLKDQSTYPDFETCATYCEEVWCVTEQSYVCLSSGSADPDYVPDPSELQACVYDYMCPLDYTLSCNDPPLRFSNPDCTMTDVPVCSCGYSFNADRDWCEKEEINICESGYTFSEYYSNKYGVHVCIAPFSCPAGSYDDADQRCETTLTWHWQCPVSAQYGCADYFGNGNVICGNVGTCSPLYDDNGTVVGYACSLGGTYSDASSCTNNCYEAWSCYKQDDCPSGYSPDWSQNVCYRQPVCPGSGSFYPPEKVCYVYAQIQCPQCSGIAANEYYSTNWGTSSPGLGSPKFDSTVDKCIYAPFCPWPTSTAPPVCPQDTLDYSNRYSIYRGPSDVCEYYAECDQYWQCPTNIEAGCVDASVPECYQGDPVDETYLQDDAPTDTNTGECLGQIYIFNGRPMKCRPPGYETGFHDCCDADSDLVNDMQGALDLTHGTLALAKMALKLKDAITHATNAIKTYNLIQNGQLYLASTKYGAYWNYAIYASSANEAAQNAVVGVLNLSPTSLLTSVAVSMAVDFAAKLAFGNCSGGDITTAIYKETGLCHYIGKKCVKKIPIIGCIQKAKVYCCFNSKLARIVHEQGRPQLMTFGSDGGWGDAKHPNCRGFVPEEFRMLDFSRIDMTEYLNDLQNRIPSQINVNINGVGQGSINIH